MENFTQILYHYDTMLFISINIFLNMLYSDMIVVEQNKINATND